MRLLPVPGVFKPPSDARLLASHLTAEGLGPGVSVLDLCTGSGYLAIAAALAGAADVTAVDVSRRAVLAARLNARLNRVRVDALCGDVFEPVRGRRFDLIVSNPPYLPTPVDELPRHGIARATEAGRSGRTFIDRICAGAADHLDDDGVLLLVHSSVCGERETLESLTNAGLNVRVAARQRGALGPMLRARAGWLREHGLLLRGDQEELLVFRARRTPIRHPSPRAGDSIRRARMEAG